MDGIPSMKTAQAVSSTEQIVPIEKMVGPAAPKHRGIPSQGLSTERLAVNAQLLLLLFVALLSFVGGVCATLVAIRAQIRGYVA